MIFFWRAAAGTLLLTGGFRCPPPCGKIAAPVRGHPAFNARLPSPGTLRPIPRLNSKRFLSVPFGTPKGTEKGPATSDSARLAAHNERRHPAKRARSCASKPHWGFDCFATAQQPGSRALGFVLAHERFASAPLRIQERTHWRLPAADSSADYSSRLKL